METWYKIVDVEKGKVKTLFHGLGGSRTLPFDKWITADKKMVCDGNSEKSKMYLSGFHVIPSYKESVEYMSKFKNLEKKAIIKVHIDGELRKKEHSPSNVWLADKILIPEEWFNICEL